MSETKPALSAEEWAQFPPGDLKYDGVLYKGDVRLPLVDGPHALAALALHAQPFGFTWEDVDRLLARAELTADPSESVWCLNLASRIVALLPPR